MQYLPLQLLQGLQQQTPKQLAQLLAAADPPHLANMAWACGQLGYRGQLLPGKLLQQAANLQPDGGAGSFKLQELCNLCWSAAVLDLQQCVPQVLQLAPPPGDLLPPPGQLGRGLLFERGNPGLELAAELLQLGLVLVQQGPALLRPPGLLLQA